MAIALTIFSVCLSDGIANATAARDGHWAAFRIAENSRATD
jgi:hypothetical protein